MKKFTEADLEAVFVELLAAEGYAHSLGESLSRNLDDVLLEADLLSYFTQMYAGDGLSQEEVGRLLLMLRSPEGDTPYERNRTFLSMLSDGFLFRRTDPTLQDLHIRLLSPNLGENCFRFVTQLTIAGFETTRRPDGILYVNGLPLVVLEFKTAIQEEVTIHDAYTQLAVRYMRDIPRLFDYNAFCVISDGANSKAGSLFSDYEFFYAWRRIGCDKKEAAGLASMQTMISGMLHPATLLRIVRDFIYLPDQSKRNEKIVCRYPQYYAAQALVESVKAASSRGDGKGGTYFGATGCGKSFTMLYLTRLLMRDRFFASPTIVLITDRTDLDQQLSRQFVEAKRFVGTDTIESVESRVELKEKLRGRESGGVYLTTIQKFSEDTDLLSERRNIICISDEAHRSQTNLGQRVSIRGGEIRKSFGFAHHLRHSFPNAVYVGFTGTPVDATLDVFGAVVESYTMRESVEDEITVTLVYEGRAAKIHLSDKKLQEIERYYESCAAQEANEEQIERSKQQMASIASILGDPDLIADIAADFVAHYEQRCSEGVASSAKALFVCPDRRIAYLLYQAIGNLRPDWLEVPSNSNFPVPAMAMVMTRGKDDPEALFTLLGDKEYRKELARQYKESDSPFRIAIVVDMWLTGFDVPMLDVMYIYKPVQQHTLIQTISRVNRKYPGKEKGLIVDYIGIKKRMNQALAHYNDEQELDLEAVGQSVVVVRNHLDLCQKLIYPRPSELYYTGTPVEQMQVLRELSEHLQRTKETEKRFLDLVRCLRSAYSICASSGELTLRECEEVQLYFALRSLIAKLTQGNAPDTATMNKRVAEMLQEAIESDGVETILRIGEEEAAAYDLFAPEYLERLSKLSTPNTKIKLLMKLLSKSIAELGRVNKMRAQDFSSRMHNVVEKYNDRSENDILRGEVVQEIIDSLTDLIRQTQKAFSAGEERGLSIEENAFYDILFTLCIKYDFTYPEDKLLVLAKSVKKLVDEKQLLPDWDKREDTKAALAFELTILLDTHGYPPVERNEVYTEILDQARSYRARNTSPK